EAISRRAAWTGWSVSFDESRTQFTLDSARNVRRIHRLSLTGVSLCIGTTPAYPDTWIETDPARASARAQQDEEAYWVARAGPIARTAWAKADDELPPQARWLENLIEKHDFYGFRRDPDRSYKRAAGLLSA
ncbi:MAG TPA: hypothetical protein VFA27_02550, partial [Vicinamibacterales bacterium]|nr:hypothetical protein [Vicinamibacterales bacterium]